VTATHEFTFDPAGKTCQFCVISSSSQPTMFIIIHPQRSLSYILIPEIEVHSFFSVHCMLVSCSKTAI